MKLEDRISAIPDFPKPGIMFRHFAPILADPSAMAYMIEEFAKKINPSEVDVFVGIESRGFIIATALAIYYKKPFVMIRKAGKLPNSTLKISYDLEYGSNTMEIEKDALKQDQRVIICDDLLATLVETWPLYSIQCLSSFLAESSMWGQNGSAVDI